MTVIGKLFHSFGAVAWYVREAVVVQNSWIPVVSSYHLAENDWGGLRPTVTEFRGSHGMEEGKGQRYLASGRQYGNALLEFATKKKLPWLWFLCLSSPDSMQTDWLPVRLISFYLYTLFPEIFIYSMIQQTVAMVTVAMLLTRRYFCRSIELFNRFSANL